MTYEKLQELKSAYPEKWEAYQKANPKNAENLFSAWCLAFTPEGDVIRTDYLEKMRLMRRPSKRRVTL